VTTPQTPGNLQYVYGIIRADAQTPGDLTGLEDKPVSAVSHGSCAALVSELEQVRPLGQRADMMAHQRVLTAFVSANLVILPFRFGGVLNSREAVEKELLADNGERLAQILDQLEGRHEVRVKGTYVEAAVLREVLTEEPQIAELNERLRNVPEDAADAFHYDRIQLGELVAQAITRRRDQEGERLLDSLTSAVTTAEVVPHMPVREEDVLDASFLIEHDKLPEFEQAVEKLSQEHQERIRLRLIGPLPPYDFVPGE
jgi:hypothetical protein